MMPRPAGRDFDTPPRPVLIRGSTCRPVLIRGSAVALIAVVRCSNSRYSFHSDPFEAFLDGCQ